MSASAASVGISYFGKLPSQRDFVKSTENHQLLALLDRWAEQGVELLARAVDWKQHYDQATPMNFAFLGPRSRVAVAGHFAPSRDASGRRYPFLAAARLDVVQPGGFMARCPLALSRLWTSLARQTHGALDADDASPLLRELGATRFPAPDPAGCESAFLDFLERQTLDSLQHLLARPDGPPVQLHRLLPALGLLLQPLLVQPQADLGRGLSLPLPADPMCLAPAATLWMDLISGFLARGSFEVAVFIRLGEQPELVLGFNGSNGRTLHGLLDPRVGAEQNIALADPEWVEDAIADDYGLRKLTSYLAEDELPLRLARDTFRETFFGA